MVRMPCWLILEIMLLETLDFYQGFANTLKMQGLVAAPDLSEVQSREDVLVICGAKYLSNGLSSLKAIADGSVDFIFSQAVLEHVRRHEFLETMQECYRILRAGGSASHSVDLKDHLGGAKQSSFPCIALGVTFLRSVR